MKIYTKFGDKGKTSLLNGRVVEKDNRLVEAYGTIDELNSYLGLIRAKCDYFSEELLTIQKDLFLVGVEIASAGKAKGNKLPPNAVERIEHLIDKISERLPPLRNFILPGGTEESSVIHIARAVCRRAERRLLSARKNRNFGENAQIYLNRLSDLLFVLARYVNWKKKKEEVLWKGKKYL